jgi:hypothetical protein
LKGSLATRAERVTDGLPRHPCRPRRDDQFNEALVRPPHQFVGALNRSNFVTLVGDLAFGIYGGGQLRQRASGDSELILHVIDATFSACARQGSLYTHIGAVC